ncbi:MAG: RES domain-containing protein [Terriglobales bacterium]
MAGPLQSLFRVFPHVDSPAATAPGGPLHVPAQGSGRLDNPGLFATLYLSDAAAGAVAEKFGRLSSWDEAMLAPPMLMPSSQWALAEYQLSPGLPVCNLDDARRLLELRLRPSEVVTRNYQRTRAWAQRLYLDGRFAAVRWWSYYESEWGSWGVWEIHRLRVVRIEALDLAHPALRAAAQVLGRPLPA